ncbi:MAG: hypothetical protein A3F72_21500 [Bacteroidetes bacterium RIFCSPLOWO2_12_FULL_35_15]|nr:MAG: hypothetical protein A3F72_21500 [Bacteroidetes bacterium RIFCSPLOWO2_12_FULL_35_15]
MTTDNNKTINKITVTMRTRNVLIVTVILLLTNCLFSSFSLAQSGSLDNTFGTGGKVTTPIGSSSSNGRSVAIQSDGKIVVAGHSNNGANYDFALARYNTDGSLDNTFGIGGKVATPIGNSDDIGSLVSIQSDGKIVVVGYSNNSGNLDFALVRYNTDGSLDNTFGTGGKVLTNFGRSSAEVRSAAIQSDGKIVVTGYCNTGGNSDFALVRYNSNGTLDNTFGLGGKVVTSFGNYEDVGYSVSIQSDGKIVVVGYSNNGADYDFALARYNSNGTLDNTFGTGGKATTPFGSSDDRGFSSAIQNDGKIVVAGYSNNGANSDFALARYNTDGYLDNTFNTDGKIVTDFENSSDEGRAIALQRDGKIVVAGFSYNGCNSDFALARYNSNGSLDNTFNTDAKATTTIVSSGDRGYSVSIQSDGKIVVTGFSYNGANNDFAIVRYNNDATGIAESTEQFNVSIYPNPTTGKIQVMCNQVPPDIGSVTDIEIYNELGERVYKSVITNQQSEIDLSDQPKGLYLYWVTNKQQLIGNGKFVIQ